MNVIVRPSVPHHCTIPGGLHDGKLVEIRGHVPYGADVFEINFCTGLDLNSDRPLHISVRFSQRVVVINTYQFNQWGPEERGGPFPFATGQDFTMLILTQASEYRIAVNSQHCWQFIHRIPYSRVNSLYIKGSVRLERIEFIDKITPYGVGTCIPPVSVYPAVGGGCHIPSYPPNPVIIPPPPPVCPEPSTYIQPGTCIQPGIQPSTYIQPSGGIQTNLTPVYNPPTPYSYPIYGGLKPGMMIFISGRPSSNAHRLTVNLQAGTSPYPPPDIAFHFDVRFYNYTIVRNSRQNNAWAAEETRVPHFAFQQGVNFDMIIKVETDKFMVALNGQHFTEFYHRLFPLARFDTLAIENDIVISSIRFG